jgi:hypothetical protein
LRKPGGSEPVARKKREKWLQIPAFLVALVHNNQNPTTKEIGGSNDDDAIYDPLEYVPPNSERQLEDVSSYR